MKILGVHCFVLALAFQLAALQHADARFDIMDPNGNITIKWDIVAWTGDGYRAIVSMYNWQLYRHIEAPGWIMGWQWSEKEVIWNIIGSETREQGDCSKWKGNLPHCCQKNPEVIDLLPGVPYNQQTANCCRGGVLSSFLQVTSYQITVGNSGSTNTTVQLPKNFTLMTPGPGYTCSRAMVQPKTKFVSTDGRQVTRAFNNWAIFWGVKFYNDMLMQAGPDGHVQSEILFRKDSSFTLNNGWGFPSHILFNGDECVLPTLDQYPTLPSSSSNL